MIISLSIRNFVLIREIEIMFHRELNVITGVTGGGKSLILKALDFLLGARSSSEIIGTYGETAEVAGVFSAGEAVKRAVLLETGVETGPEDNLILRRVYRGDRTNLCYLNGSPVNVSSLRRIGEMLVDYLAQNHQLNLQKTSHQLSLVDSYAGTSGLLSAYGDIYAQLREKERIQRDLEENRSEWERKTENLRHALEEISTMDLTPGEDEKLKQDIAVYEHLSSILTAFQNAQTGLYEGEQSAYDILYSVSKVISSLDSVPPELAKIREDADDITERLSGLVTDMRSYADSVDFGEHSFSEIEERFYAVQDLKHKYDMSVEELLAYARELPEKIEECVKMLSESGSIADEIVWLREKTVEAGRKLEAKRKKGIPSFEKELKQNLGLLGMDQCEFSAGLNTRPMEAVHATETGFSSTDFLFSANPGVDPRPLREIASGGELSRIMLAIQAALRSGTEQPVLVFDEIDSEIGGRLGNVIGTMMKKISGTRQIICITHLPQLACFGDTHFKIDKNVKQGTTEVVINPLDEEPRILELAQMLRGDDAKEETTINEIKHMLENVKNAK